MDEPPILPRCKLRLFIAGLTPRSTLAIEDVRHICSGPLNGRADLEMVDIRKQPDMAVADQVVAVPALLKLEPEPRRRVLGVFSDEGRVMRGLGLVVESTAQRFLSHMLCPVGNFWQAAMATLTRLQEYVFHHLARVVGRPYLLNKPGSLRRYQLDGKDCSPQITGLVIGGYVREDIGALVKLRELVPRFPVPDSLAIAATGAPLVVSAIASAPLTPSVLDPALQQPETLPASS